MPRRLDGAIRQITRTLQQEANGVARVSHTRPNLWRKIWSGGKNEASVYSGPQFAMMPFLSNFVLNDPPQDLNLRLPAPKAEVLPGRAIVAQLPKSLLSEILRHETRVFEFRRTHPILQDGTGNTRVSVPPSVPLHGEPAFAQ